MRHAVCCRGRPHVCASALGRNEASRHWPIIVSTFSPLTLLQFSDAIQAIQAEPLAPRFDLSTFEAARQVGAAAGVSLCYTRVRVLKHAVLVGEWSWLLHLAWVAGWSELDRMRSPRGLLLLLLLHSPKPSRLDCCIALRTLLCTLDCLVPTGQHGQHRRSRTARPLQ